MIDKLIIWTPEPSDEYGAFSDCQEIKQPKPICGLCSENEADYIVTFKRHDRTHKEHVCDKCFNVPDFREILQNSIIISVTKIN